MTNDSTPRTSGRQKGYEARIAIMRSGLRPAAKFVAIRILDAQGLKDGACTLSVAKLAEDCGLPASTVKRALRELTETGCLHAGSQPGRRARRTLLVESLPVAPMQPVPPMQPVAPMQPGGATGGTSYREGSEKDHEKDLRSQRPGVDEAITEPAITAHKLHEVYLRRRRKKLPLVALPRTGPGSETGMWDPLWERLLVQLGAQARVEGGDAAAVAARVYRAAFADEWARDKGFPPSLLLSKFAEYIQAAGPVRAVVAKPVEPERFFRWLDGHTLRRKVIDRVTDEEWFDDEPAPQSAIDAGYRPLRQRAA